ncbi:MAG: hypothetical protein WED04_10240 [Promethearchaeati archaeon SRVP18_Atabeyarchaeia-1]
MSRKVKIAASAVIVSLLCVGSGLAWLFLFRHPGTLPLGETPAIGLPLYDFSHNNMIGGFGNIHRLDNTTYYHNGIDFSVNGTTNFVCPFSAYVDEVRTWFNDKGGHWQTNVRLWINSQWAIEIIFESWALNETYGNLEADAVSVVLGQLVVANQTVGNLLVFGNGAHVHFGVLSNSNAICPYNVFTPSAKATFATQFYKVNSTPSWYMP